MLRSRESSGELVSRLVAQDSSDRLRLRLIGGLFGPRQRARPPHFAADVVGQNRHQGGPDDKGVDQYAEGDSEAHLTEGDERKNSSTRKVAARTMPALVMTRRSR